VQISRYRRRVSGPLLDRIDLALEVPPVTEADMGHSMRPESTATVRARVVQARNAQLSRQGVPNALIEPGELDQHCALDAGALTLMQRAVDRLSLSARAFQRIRRVARTIADLEGAETIGTVQVAEAIQYRRFDGAPAQRAPVPVLVPVPSV
jgi:magnesium chelatase family protein